MQPPALSGSRCYGLPPQRPTVETVIVPTPNRKPFMRLSAVFPRRAFRAYTEQVP